MKLKDLFLRYSNAGLLAAGVLIFFTGCVTVDAVHESPSRYGVGVSAAPGLQIGESSTSVHGIVGYSHIPFKGGGGSNNIFRIGAQMRFGLSENAPEGFWVGGELAYLNFRNKYSGSSIKQTAPAFTLGGLAGYRFKAGKVPMSFYFAPAYLKRGKFKTNGTTAGTGGSGYYARLGLDIHLFSLMHKKGR
ncbi:MAG: hypothetical protein GC171_06515 [Terrimonas sp.]|nr:hypothetical protein [Terrimonas sp.]